jgi:hypothetical protein
MRKRAQMGPQFAAGSSAVPPRAVAREALRDGLWTTRLPGSAPALQSAIFMKCEPSHTSRPIPYFFHRRRSREGVARHDRHPCCPDCISYYRYGRSGSFCSRSKAGFPGTSTGSSYETLLLSELAEGAKGG